MKGFDPTLSLSVKDARKVDVFVQFGVEAARQAVEDAGFTPTEDEQLAQRYGVVIGAGIGGLPLIEATRDGVVKEGARRISPFFIPGAIINMVSGLVSMKYRLCGPNLAVVTACTTGVHAIGQAARMIERGDADLMVAGGTEMTTTPLGVGGFSSMRATSRRNDEPTRASRPWDRDRDGFVLGEGAGVVVLESYEHAKARGARIYAELIGFGMSGDAYHMTSPDPEAKGFRHAIANALRDADLSPEAVDYVNAHGTSTPTGDPLEIKAIKDVFGAHAYRLAVSSTKSMTGHMLGAAGSAEAIFCILALQDQIVPPTINLDNPSEDCDLNLVPHKPQERPLNVVLSNSFGFGGTNGSVIFRRAR